MKAKILHILIVSCAVVTVLAGLDLKEILPLFPPGAAAYIGSISAALTALLAVIRITGDILDDGTHNDSFPPKKP